jgi:hypothetical protein
LRFQFRARVDYRNQLLDLLVRSAEFDGTYKQHLKRFKERGDLFFPQSYAKPPAPQVAPVEEPHSKKNATLLISHKDFKNRLSRG